MAQVRSALIMNEFQREWLDPEAELHKLVPAAEMATAIASAKQALAAARKARMVIVHAGVKLSATYGELGHATHGLRKILAQNRRFAGTRADFVAPFAPEGEEYVSWRPGTTSDFVGSNLDHYLRNQRVEHVYLAGFALHVCVLATAVHANDLGYEVTLLSDATGSFKPEQRRFVLDDAMHHYGDTITVEKFVSSLEAGAS